jgi:serine phosphatase RsbU (regulator of sigma subunit)
VIEAENDQQELFGEQRLTELLSTHRQMDADQLIKKIIEQVQLFTGHQYFQDDISLVIMKVKE